jgi:hypothetical protein
MPKLFGFSKKKMKVGLPFACVCASFSQPHSLTATAAAKNISLFHSFRAETYINWLQEEEDCA